jgi:carbonic anhydrase
MVTKHQSMNIVRIVLRLLLSFLIFSHAFSANNGSSWSYSGNNGPTKWGSLSEKYALCSSGLNQSPIDIRNALGSNLFELDFSYGTVPLQILNNGHTIQVNYETTKKSIDNVVTLEEKEFLLPSATRYNSTLSISGEEYRLLQFHFHSPSEHKVNGRSYPLEVHYVHASSAGQLAVVGVLFEEGESNRFISKIWSHMPQASNRVHTITSVQLNAEDMLPNSRSYSHYRGSLTTPPCSESVRWFVMNETIEASSSQISKFLSVVSENARPIQNLNSRFLLESE